MTSSLVTPFLYRTATKVCGPLINTYLRRRLAQGKEDGARFRERLGFPSQPRPHGILIWIHAASVGESMSVLPLIESLVAERSDLHILLTTGTVTSAKLMGNRLPARAFHQYVPVDRIAGVRSFLDHWRPDLAIWVESEFWPNLIMETHARGVPMLLLNARVSEASFQSWQRYPRLIAPMLQCFDLCLAQTLTDIGRLTSLGAASATCRGNLKWAGNPLPAEPKDLEKLERMFGDRPRWLAASTHAGEETIIAETHKILRRSFAGTLTIIVPRHPNRGPEIAKALKEAGLKVRRRAGFEPADAETDIYLADTIGELGLFYRLADIVFVGGSLIPHGGQNPLEAARLDSAILYGPHMFNFAETVDALEVAGATGTVTDAASLAAEITRLTTEEGLLDRRALAATKVAAEGREVLEAVKAEILGFLPGGESLRESA